MKLVLVRVSLTALLILLGLVIHTFLITFFPGESGGGGFLVSGDAILYSLLLFFVWIPLSFKYGRKWSVKIVDNSEKINRGK